MKLKWLSAFFVLLLSATFVFSAMAGHASRSRRTGSVITTGSSEIIVPNKGGHHKEIMGLSLPLHGNPPPAPSFNVQVRVNEQIRPVQGQSTIQGILFCGFAGGDKLIEEMPLTGGGGSVIRKPGNTATYTAASTVSSGEINNQGEFGYEVVSLPNLASLNCGFGRTALDFVPIQFESVVTETVIIQKNSKHKFGYIQSYAIDRCTLPNPQTLAYREQRPYQCTVVREIEIGGSHHH